MLKLWMSIALAAVPQDANFVKLHEENKVQVEILRSKPPWVRGTVILSEPAEKITKVLSDYPNYGSIFEGLIDEVKLLESKGAKARFHMVWDYPFPYRDRDSIVAYEYEKPNKKTFRLFWKDDVKKGDPEDGVRIPAVEGETVVIRLGKDKSKVVYTYLAELGADFGKSNNEKAYKKEPIHYFEILEKALKAKPEKKEK